ncbi:sensor histidine kinase [Lapidilactobacillus luobeiensis]|uniref:sensor histidine kinase n=1 Tax=Lapidilactobacillus luobeiensis TaxID=2950371 RepID=UPI0021C25A00|nr:HAMP domain-containing sensor histidine kinase [Lapidilactobacillus luobeiensis]
MQNKVEFKRMLRQASIVVAVGIVLLVGLFWWHDHLVKVRVNQALATIVTTVATKYPQVTKGELIGLLAQPKTNAQASLLDYGLDLRTDNVIGGLNRLQWVFIAGDLILVGLLVGGIVAIFLRYNRRKDADLQQIVADVAAINRREYQLDLADYSEDELSILRNELHKTTLVLREAADNSLRDKRLLKVALSDISHQIKTPLTSILVMVDNILDDPQMTPAIRTDFLQRIKHETTSINFLVSALLKLSKFDAATVQFHPQLAKPEEIISAACDRVSVLADLRGVDLEQSGTGIPIKCDLKWQSEALSNILKNCIEHSAPQTTISIQLTSNKLFTTITVTDHGSGIASVDLPHIFERFYQAQRLDGQPPVQNSVGIGLALAKAIVEHDRGDLSVRSTVGVGSVFTLRYFFH